MLSKMIKSMVLAPFKVLLPEAKITFYLDLWKSGWRPKVRSPIKTVHSSILKTHEDCEKSFNTVKSLGLPPHPDRPKNWDALIAVSEIVSEVPKDMPVLDAGGTLYSPILRWLFLLGYKNLQSIDLIFPKIIKRGPLVYYPGDLTSSNFADEQFSAITCMSVIEHGVPIDEYFEEMYRILKPGGLLITSTDYWETPIDTKGLEAYGTNIKIYCKSDVQDLLKAALKKGFEVMEELDYSCNEKVVHWERFGIEFTYLIFKLRKPYGA